MRPLIGMTASLVEREWAGGLVMPATLAWSTYTRAIAAAGGVPVVLAADGQGVDEALAAIDGLLLPGGSDIDPSYYGEASVHPTVYGITPDRDQFELALARGAVARDLPLLAICRGIQVLNVALGGTLYQDVPSGLPGALTHSQETAPGDVCHPVRLAEGSCLARLYGGATVGANSFHHQAVREVAPGLRAVAWTDDGLIEGVESATHRFVVGVQWHPEAQVETHAEHRGLFAGLIECAAEYRAAKAASLTAGR